MAKKVLWAVPMLFIGLLFYVPLFNILGRGFTQEWVHDLVDPATLEILWFTVWQAVVSTLVCLVLAVPGAYALYRKRFRYQKLLRALITVPFMLPTIVVATAFTTFHQRNTPDSIWIIVAHVFINYSLAVRTIGSHWAELDKSIEEAAELAGAGRIRSFFYVALPQLSGSFVSAAASIFLYSASSYGIILMVGGGLVHSLETEIAAAAIGLGDLPRTAALSLLQTLLSVAAFTLTLRRGAHDVDFDGFGAKRSALDKRDLPALLVTGVVVLSLLIIPLATIVVRAFTSDKGLFHYFLKFGSLGYRNLLNVSVAQAAGNSLRNMLLSACIAVAVGVLLAWLSAHTKNRKLQAIFDVALLMPLGISTIVLGLGYLVTFSSPILPLRESWLAVPLIQSVMAVPLVLRIVKPAFVGINKSLLESAFTEGATRWQTFREIEVPMVKHALVTAAAFACLVSIGEFGAASLLAFGQQATLPTVLYSLISRPGGDNYGMAMAVSVLLMAFTFAVVLIVSVESRRPLRRQRNVYA